MTVELLQVSAIEGSAVAAPPELAPGGPAPGEPALTVRRAARPPAQVGEASTLAAVVGLGAGGLGSALALRRAGLRVLGVETSASRLADIRCGRVGLPAGEREQLREHCRDEAAFALTDELARVASADAVLICVPTSLDRQRRPGAEALRRACEAVVRHARAGQTIVLSSTVGVGGTRQLLLEPLQRRGLTVGEDVFVAFCPEQVRDEQDGSCRQRPIVGAATEACARNATALLANLGAEPLRVSTPETAEMVRLWESSVEAVTSALAFELADACRTYGVQPQEVSDAAQARPAPAATLAPALPAQRTAADPHHLLHPLRERGRPATLAEEALRRVDGRPRRLAMRAYELLGRATKQVHDQRVLVVGAASEPVLDDLRAAPAVEVIERLRATGAQVDFHDPLVPALPIDGEELAGVDPDPRRDASGFGPEDYDLAIVLARREGYDYGWLRRCPQVLDCTYRERTGRRCFLP